MNNRIDAVLTAANRDVVLDHIAQIRALLPFLLDLSPEDRQALPKMGDKSRAFVSQALQLAEQDDSYLPRSFEVADMRQDVTLAESLYPIMTGLKQLSELIEDTYLQVGSEAYTAALIVYQFAQSSGRGAGLDELLDALGQRFARKSKDKSDDPDEPDDPNEN